MPIFPNVFYGRHRADQLTEELAAAYKRIGILHACAVLKPSLLDGDVDVALFLLDELQREATS
jgi:hypothetical protein